MCYKTQFSSDITTKYFASKTTNILDPYKCEIGSLCNFYQLTNVFALRFRLGLFKSVIEDQDLLPFKHQR